MTEPELDGRRKFAMIPEAMLFDPDIPGEAVKVFGVLHRYGSTPDKCFPSLRIVAGKAGLTVRSVRRHVALLEAKGWLRRITRMAERGDQDSNAYQLFAQPTPPDTGVTTPGQECPTPRTEMTGPPGQICHDPPDTGVRQKRAIEREPLNENGQSPHATVIDITTRQERETAPTFDDDFWPVWPRKVGKLDARKAWAKALKHGVDPGEIVAGARRLAEDPNRPELRFVPHPATWLNGERWTDEDPFPATTVARQPAKAPVSFPEASSQW